MKAKATIKTTLPQKTYQISLLNFMQPNCIKLYVGKMFSDFLNYVLNISRLILYWRSCNSIHKT